MSDPILSTNQHRELADMLNRPDDMNTLTIGLVDALHDALSTVHADHDCRAVVLTGAGRAFCAGLDLKGYGTIPGTESFEHCNREWQWHNTLLRLFQDAPIRQPIIVQSLQLPVADLRGGKRYPLLQRQCEIRHSFHSTWSFWLRYWRELTLPRLIGVSRAWELIYTGRVIDAAEAERLGIVSRSVLPENLMDTALGVAEEIAANSPFGIWMTKEVL